MKYYHVTDRTNLDSVLRLGLLVTPPRGTKETTVMSLYRVVEPDELGYICLSDDIEEAYYFAENYGGEGVILEVSLPAEWVLEDDPVVPGMGSYVSRRDIPAKYLKVVE